MSGDFVIRPEAEEILKERWSDLSPEEGTELCVCSWCGKMIGRDERDPVWKDHIEYCPGCETCEIAVRCFRRHPDGTVSELRFHLECLKEVLLPEADVL